MLVVGTEESFIKSRYALAEAKRASSLLRDEDKEKLLEVATNFGWDARLVTESSLQHYAFCCSFSGFLEECYRFCVVHDARWKLVNHLMIDGEVYLTEREVSRLLEEEVRKYIEERLDTKISSHSSSYHGSSNPVEATGCRETRADSA